MEALHRPGEHTSADTASYAETMSGGRRMDRESVATRACRAVEGEGSMESHWEGTQELKWQG